MAVDRDVIDKTDPPAGGPFRNNAVTKPAYASD
jgi:hypothetical protein